MLMSIRGTKMVILLIIDSYINIKIEVLMCTIYKLILIATQKATIYNRRRHWAFRAFIQFISTSGENLKLN